MQLPVVDVNNGLPISSVFFSSKSEGSKNFVTGDSAI
jgi:hypothetical protein